jgi:uncharacterized protein
MERNRCMANSFVYVQLHTQDHKKAKDFYTSLFDWKLEDNPAAEIPYTEIDVGGEGVSGGMMAAVAPEIPSHWLPFVHVHDIEETTQKAKTLGATVIKKPTNVPGKGRYSVIVDPTGATFALWEPILHR